MLCIVVLKAKCGVGRRFQELEPNLLDKDLHEVLPSLSSLATAGGAAQWSK